MDDDSSELREPFLPLGGDTSNYEDHRQRRCQRTTTDSSCGVGGDLPAESCERNENGFVGDDNDDDLYPPKLVAAAVSNIRKSLFIVFGDLATKSIWSPNIVSVFVILVWKDHPEYVGFVQFTLGILQTLSSVAIANWSTKEQHSSSSGIGLVKLASLTGLCAVLVSVVSIAMQVYPRCGTNTDFFFVSKFVWFLLANGLWGLFWGVMESALPMVFVDSVNAISFGTQQQNTKQLIDRHQTVVGLGGVFGTLLALVVFYQLGNEWTVRNCGAVLMGGAACNLSGVIALSFLRSMDSFGDDENNEREYRNEDDWMVGNGEREEPFCYSEAADKNQGVASSTEAEEAERYKPLISQDEEDIIRINDEIYNEPNSSSTEDRYNLIPRNSHDDAIHGHMDDDESSLVFHQESAAEDAEMTTNNNNSTCIHLADAISSLAGGLSAWYFPVFLVQVLELRPMSIQGLCLIILVGQNRSPFLAKALARTIGPCRACILLQLVYVNFLVLMVTCSQSSVDHHRVVWKVCALYVLHGSLMNSTSSLSKDMLIANTYRSFEEQQEEEQQQLSWSSTYTAETLQKLLWSCSGLLGGWMASSSKWGLLVNFYSTACFQFLACLPLVVLYCWKGDPVVLVEDSSRGETEEENDMNDGNDDGNDGFGDPQASTSPFCPQTRNLASSSAATPTTESAESDYDDDDDDDDVIDDDDHYYDVDDYHSARDDSTYYSARDSMSPTTWVV